MVEVTQALAERISELARLLESDGDQDAAMARLTALGVELVPGATAAAVTVTAGDQAHTFAASDARVDELHRLQFASGTGPVVETVRYNEARHVRDVSADPRWPTFSRAASAAGFGSCITLPLHTRQEPAGAVALYAERPHAFSGAAHDLALLFAAQGGTAAHNADLYGASRRVVHNLQVALESRAVIEQAKGIVHAELDVSVDAAFELLSRASQNTNEKVRDIAAAIVRGEISPQQLRARGL
jgi:GAF domain-containing protein